MNQNLLKQRVVEFIGTFALIFVGVCAIRNNDLAAGVSLLGVALAGLIYRRFLIKESK